MLNSSSTYSVQTFSSCLLGKGVSCMRLFNQILASAYALHGSIWIPPTLILAPSRNFRPPFPFMCFYLMLSILPLVTSSSLSFMLLLCVILLRYHLCFNLTHPFFHKSLSLSRLLQYSLLSFTDASSSPFLSFFVCIYFILSLISLFIIPLCFVLNHSPNDMHHCATPKYLWFNSHITIQCDESCSLTLKHNAPNSQTTMSLT